MGMVPGVSPIRARPENEDNPSVAVPQTDKQGKKISTKGHEGLRRATKGLIDELLIGGWDH